MNTQYNLRIAICRKLISSRTRHNEAREDWPESARYSAKRLALNAGEEIRLGVHDGTEFLKIEIQGANIPVAYEDRIRVVSTGRVYRITAPPIRLERVTVLQCESVKGL